MNNFLSNVNAFFCVLTGGLEFRLMSGSMLLNGVKTVGMPVHVIYRSTTHIRNSILHKRSLIA